MLIPEPGWSDADESLLREWTEAWLGYEQAKRDAKAAIPELQRRLNFPAPPIT